MTNLSSDFNDRGLWRVFNIDYATEQSLEETAFLEKWDAKLICEYYDDSFPDEAGSGVVVAVPAEKAQDLIARRRDEGVLPLPAHMIEADMDWLRSMSRVRGFKISKINVDLKPV